MRQPSIKISVRQMMVVVALGGILLWAGQIEWRAQHYGNLAFAHEQNARSIDAQARSLQFYAERHKSKGEPVPESLAKDIRDREETVKAERRLVRKYSEAASHPWRAVGDVDGPGSKR